MQFPIQSIPIQYPPMIPIAIPFSTSYPIPNFPIQPNQSHYYNPNYHQKSKRIKVKGPPKFFCEPCEKSFQSQDDYSKHLQKHMPCEEPGCKFMGSVSGLQVHHVRVHNERLRDLLKNIDTPEGLAKYREERKKKIILQRKIYLKRKMIYKRKENVVN